MVEPVELQPLHPEAVDAMGHWSPGTGMGALYDGKACVSELLNKEKVLKAVAKHADVLRPYRVAAWPATGTGI